MNHQGRDEVDGTTGVSDAGWSGCGERKEKEDENGGERGGGRGR